MTASKYGPLRDALEQSAGAGATLRLEQIAAMVGGLPESAFRYRAWWSNNPSGHSQARSWLDAGFRVSDLQTDSVTFVLVRNRLARLDVMGLSGDGVSVRGVLRLVDGAVEADADGRWLMSSFVAVLPDGSESRRVTPSDGAAFLVACWFSLRGPQGAWGQLVDVDGHELTREEGLELVRAFEGVGLRFEDASPEVSPIDAFEDAEPGIGGDSPEQRRAEVYLMGEASGVLGASLEPRRLKLDGRVVALDGYSEDPPVLAEAWAHHGPPKPAQKYKVMADATKMTWVAAVHFPKGCRKVMVFADRAAAQHFLGTSWMAGALTHLGIEVLVFELPAPLRDAVKRAQKRQAPGGPR